MPLDEAGNKDRLIHVCGDDALSVSFDAPFMCQSVAEQLRQTGEWLESVAGIESVVVQFDAAITSLEAAADRLHEQLSSMSVTAVTQSSLIEVPVCYGGDFGPDFESLCETLDLAADELTKLHTAGEYRVEMLGFTPGFAYVSGLPDTLNVPRLAQPRLRVEAGSVGIADGRSGLYAMSGPGGWPIIGRTPMRLFDPHSDRPFILSAGTRVRFKAIDADRFQKMERR